MVGLKYLVHFLLWLIIPFIIFYYFHDVMYWYAVIGSLLVLIIYYYSYFGKKTFLPALGGWALAFVISYYVI